MKIFFTTLISFFLIINNIYSNEIKDFQIGGMSVKDSLLEYFDSESIKKELNTPYPFFYKNNIYAAITAGNGSEYDLRINSDTYDDIGITIKPNDKNFLIYALSGRIFCPEDINYCKSKKKEIEQELLKFFGNKMEVIRSNADHSYDKTGKSKTFNTYFKFESGDYVSVSTIDWSKEAKNPDGVAFPDNTKVTITTYEFEKFLANVQYK